MLKDRILNDSTENADCKYKIRLTIKSEKSVEV